ncbi:MAG: cyclic nucleotide-binding domain-containing protein, partial [Deltaproteobacteria bacterium]|nr:cyclic nucleotide-binding domain-containing protein [Deltaproteobacteria bacterium]
AEVPPESLPSASSEVLAPSPPAPLPKNDALPPTADDAFESTPPSPPSRKAEMLRPDGDAVELLEPSSQDKRKARATARMDSAAVSTLLRQDAELAYREAKSTECYAAIQREVLADVEKEEDLQALDPVDDEATERDLEEMLRDLPSQSQDFPADAPPLPEIPLFSELGGEAFVALVNRLDARLYESGEYVVREGEPGDSLLLISAGQLSVQKNSGETRVELASLGPGAFFGEFGLLTDHRRHASVLCLRETEILELRRDVLADLIRDHPSVQDTLRDFYRRRVLEMVLATSPLFRVVSPDERNAIVSRFVTRRFMDGDIIVKEGTHAGAFFVILVGHVEVTCLDQEGHVVPVGSLVEGQYFGEMSLISGYPAEATVRAAHVTEVLSLDELAFYEMASTHPEIWAEVQRESQNRAEANDRILADRRADSLLV